MRLERLVLGFACAVLGACGTQGDEAEVTDTQGAANGTGDAGAELTDTDAGVCNGPECDEPDLDSDVGSGACQAGKEGCPCSEGTAPVDCQISKAAAPHSELCKDGKSYCRDGQWTGCRGIAVIESGS